ncbi:MAG: hemolysin family protein [Verrucomicrobiae bacterium]|nr:hemolysin family protein [Verrucomicrobiae bacterium]
MDPTPVQGAIAFVICAGASFFFALAETALFSLSKWQLDQLAQTGDPRAKKVQALLSNPDDLLASIVLGNTFATAGMVGVVVWVALRGFWPLIPSVAVSLVVVLLGCEVLPKTLAVRRPERWSLRVAEPMRLIHALGKPLRAVAQALNGAVLKALLPGVSNPRPGITDEEYQELLELAFQQGALARAERDIILQIIRLDRRTAREVMIPRAQMQTVSDDASIEEMIEAARRYKKPRLPIYDEATDTIVGILNTRVLLLDPNADLAEAIEIPSFVPESMNMLQLLKSLQQQQRGLAIVLDEFGDLAGMVTTEDILNEIVGGVRAVAPAERLVLERLGPGKWRVSGSLRLDDFRREYPQLGRVPEVETMGGLMLSLLDSVPVPGQSVVFRGLKLTAHVADERRVRELLVEVVK